MRKNLFWIASLALGLVACSDKDIPSPGETENNVGNEEVSSVSEPMQRMNLTATPSDQSRVTLFAGTRAEGELEPGQLKLIASIDNPSKDKDSDFTLDPGKDARYLSATCVYYDEIEDRYIATYHMQGNNYNTHLDRDVAGFIETFKIKDDGTVDVENIYRSEDPSKVDFDFNHLYFDNMAQHVSFNGQVQGHINEDRVIAVGHLIQSTSTGKSDTKAIIGKLDLEGNPSFEYKVVYTGEKILDENGKSLGRVDAQDVNAVVRRFDTYYLATRKGIALLNAMDEENQLFEPRFDKVGNNYFIKSKGSVKHVACDGGYSKVAFLYLTEDFPEGFNGETEIAARMVKVDITNDGLTGEANFGYGNSYDTQLTDVSGIDIKDLDKYGNGWSTFNVTFDKPVAPIDGKNVLFMPSVGENQYYAALGKAGLYFKNNNSGQFGKSDTGNLDFGNRPVNGVFVDDGINTEHHHGFIYVCNGSKLSIFNRYKLDEVTSYNLPSDADGSANYVVVRTAEEVNQDGTYDRIITVAFGQEGIKIFRFHPKNVY